MDASLHPLHRHWENHRMNRIAILDAADRRVVLAEGAQRLKLLPVVLEKDFWVCWMLGLLFGRPERSEALVFKGGTALSKVFGVIQRFSEDIDLSVAPATLGFAEAEMDESMSRRRRGQLIENLEAACRQWVAERLQPELEQEITAVVGARPGGARWLEFETDTVTQSPVLYFHYPGTQEVDVPYIRRAVKLELGSLTDQRPVGRHRVRPWLAEVLPGPLAGMACDVVALDVGRAFWEKATILHAEHHRDAESPMPGNYSRHYADVAALAACHEVRHALLDIALLERVVDWKSRFFARSWARYDLAKPGTFRLVPPEFRLSELEADYAKMRPMFLAEPPPFAEIIEGVRGLETRINRAA